MSVRLTVYVYTADLERLRRFYAAGLGVEPGTQHGNWLPFELGGATFALHGVSEPGDRDLQRANLNFETDDIEALVARCEAAGATVLRGVSDEAFGRRAMLRDPDGRTFEAVSHGG